MEAAKRARRAAARHVVRQPGPKASPKSHADPSPPNRIGTMSNRYFSPAELAEATEDFEAIGMPFGRIPAAAGTGLSSFGSSPFGSRRLPPLQSHCAR